jgi:uncharacterized damage-inducible protein DinB
MTPHLFRQLAAYNRWANARLYAAALDLSDQGYPVHIGRLRKPSWQLNHLLLFDRLWLIWRTGKMIGVKFLL